MGSVALNHCSIEGKGEAQYRLLIRVKPGLEHTAPESCKGNVKHHREWRVLWSVNSKDRGFVFPEPSLLLFFLAESLCSKDLLSE